MTPDVNYYAVLASAFIALAVGAVWYGPLFGTLWKRLEGLSDEAMRTMSLSPLQAMTGGFITSLMMMYVLAQLHISSTAYYTLSSGLAGGLMNAFWLWIGFAVPLTAGSFLWSGKSWKLWALNASYYLVVLMLAGALMGAWV